MNGIVCKDAWDLVYSGQTDGQSSLKMQYTVVPVSLKMQQTNKQTILWRHIHNSIAHQAVTLKTLTPAAEYVKSENNTHFFLS